VSVSFGVGGVGMDVLAAMCNVTPTPSCIVEETTVHVICIVCHYPPEESGWGKKMHSPD